MPDSDENKSPCLDVDSDLLDRPRYFDPDVTWCLEQTADDPKYAYRRRAVFVVHGIGAMDRSSGTSVDLRYGFEDAADELRPRDPNPPHRVTAGWIAVPATYIKEGYWGNYRKVEEAFPDLYSSMPAPSQSYFKALWNVRTRSADRTGWWLVKQAARLIPVSLRNFFSDLTFRTFLFKLARPPIYLLVLLVVVLTIPGMLLFPWGRKALSDVVGDVRLYVDPEGAIEHAMVQWIDRRVAALFLQLFGLDLNFDPLPDDAPVFAMRGIPQSKLRMDDCPLQFEEVVWVSHSLGTVVSYNVLSDLVEKAQRLPMNTEEDKARKLRADKALQSIHRFYTLGSPLQKVAFLFPGVLRRWPDDWRGEKEKQAKTDGDHWWVNFFHILDPVSGIPTDKTLFGAIPQSVHSPSIWTLPGLAHVSYWHETKVAKYILHQTHLPPTTIPPAPWTQTPAPLPERAELWKIYWDLVMIISLLVVFVVEAGTLYGVAAYYSAWLWKNIPAPLQHFILHLPALTSRFSVWGWHGLMHLLGL